MRSDHRASLLSIRSYSPALFSVTFRAPDLARVIRPGQFVMLESGQRIRPYLRRAYSVADADREKGEIELLVKAIGPGTAALQELAPGAFANLLGPLGNAFSFNGLARGSRVAVVAGGIGAAPFPLLYRAFSAAGIVGDFFLGGRNQEDLSFQERFSGIVTGRTYLATDDGSLGERGFVTELFQLRAAENSYRRVFACGPMPMFRALARIVAALDLPAEFSTEADMGCGFGACLGCVIPGVERPFLISCQEGPILRPEQVRWP